MRHLVFTRVDGRPVVVRRRRGGEKRARGEVGHMSFGSYTTLFLEVGAEGRGSAVEPHSASSDVAA